MLVVLKGLLPLFPHLRVILMSATLNTDAFSSYFDQCPVLSVPGFTHPVEDFFLEEVPPVASDLAQPASWHRRPPPCAMQLS